MHLDVVMLSRIQFALTLMFHYLFPPLTIGLGVFMVIVETLWFKSGNPLYKRAAHFWTNLFAVNFAIGVATGIVMEFQFGTNWAVYSRFVGDVFGAALASEAIFAFFLESGFLAVLVFGWDRVGKGMHLFATCMVALGSIFSSIWITIANSWQQTPAGYHLVKTASGMYRAEITDFWAMVFNPSSVQRITHVWLAAFILGALFALSISSFYLLRGKFEDFAKLMMKPALIYLTVTSSVMLLSGHEQALGVSVNQPAKLAAFEGHYHTGAGGTEMFLIGLPDSSSESVKYGLSVPGLLSFLVYGDPNRPVTGLDKVAVEDRPPVLVPFMSYHLMAGLGGFFILISWLGLVFLISGKLFEQKWLLWTYVLSVLGGYAANESGWISAEVGRQPWIVYGLLRTRDAVSQTVPGEHVLISIFMFTVVYSFLFWVWVHVMNHKIQAGPPAVKDVGLKPSHQGKGVLETIKDLLNRGPSSLSESWRADTEGEETT